MSHTTQARRSNHVNLTDRGRCLPGMPRSGLGPCPVGMMRIEAPLAGGRTKSRVLLRLAGKPHDGNLAVGLLLVCAIAWGDRRDAGECLGPLLALEGLTADL